MLSDMKRETAAQGVLSKKKEVRPRFTDGEMADLTRVSETWGVSVRTIVWYFTSVQLAKMRKRRLMDAPYSDATLDVISAIESAAGLEKEEEEGVECTQEQDPKLSSEGYPGEQGLESERDG